MARGSAVIKYEGKRGAVWRIKFHDADGKQIMETLGRETDGWTERKAQRALGARLAVVENTRWRKPEKLTFGLFAERFENEFLPTRNLKPSTLIDYRTTLRLHLIPFFGEMELVAVEAADVDGYIGSKTKALSPKTISNHLGLLRLMFKTESGGSSYSTTRSTTWTRHGSSHPR